MIRLDIGDYYTRKEVANLLKVKEPIVHKYAKQGKFREFKQHRNCSGLYPKQDIENFIKKYFGLVDLDQQSHQDNLPTTAFSNANSLNVISYFSLILSFSAKFTFRLSLCFLALARLRVGYSPRVILLYLKVLGHL